MVAWFKLQSPTQCTKCHRRIRNLYAHVMLECAVGNNIAQQLLISTGNAHISMQNDPFYITQAKNILASTDTQVLKQVASRLQEWCEAEVP